MLKSRRGLLAAGLALAVVGAIGAASTLIAGAEEIPDDAAPRPVAAEASGVPPTLLPWGQRPEAISRGRAGATSKTLRDQGLDAAANDTSGSTQPRGRYAPKGLTEEDGELDSQLTDVKPPEPPGPPGAQPSDPTPSTGATPDDIDLTPPSDVPTPPPTTAAVIEPTDPETTPTATTSAVAPAPTASANASATVNYLYSGGRQTATTDGIYANVTIAKPTLASGDYHTLAELALQSADSQQTVEVGWTVDRVVNGDDDPHLFVYHWVNNKATCYNGCGFVQYSSTIKPGDTLAYGVAKKFGIQYSGDAWWIAFDSEWVGYFPEKLWINAGVASFAKSGLVQAFGEVAAPSTKPCSQMGNGVTASSTSSAALMASMTYLNGPTVTLETHSTIDAYPVAALSTRTFRYGGPGAC